MKKQASYLNHDSVFTKRRLEIFVLALGCISLLYACSSKPEPKTNTSLSSTELPSSNTATTSGTPAAAKPESEIPAIDTTEPGTGEFSRFNHGNEFHSRLPCLLCHNRESNAARIGFPGKTNHLPCAGCHALQFSDQSSQICTICHTDAQTGAMKAFPPLRSFGVKFNHSKHTGVNCATCHKPDGRGVARTIPAGTAAHSTCFQCHTANAAFSMSSCSVCHQPGRLVRTPVTAAAFRRGFSHAKHAGSASLTCNSCHQVRAGSARGKQVTAPLTSMHFPPQRTQSCSTCHDGKRAFGADDFANCKRCHQGPAFRL